jgi:hypothetical protein
MAAPPNDAEPPQADFATLIAAGRMREICDAGLIAVARRARFPISNDGRTDHG